MADVVWIDVLPAMGGFAKDLMVGSTKAAQDAGYGAGNAWGKTFSGAAGDGGSNALVTQLEAASRKATKAVNDQTVQISKARAAQSDAAAKVVEAEQKLTQARETGDPAKIEAAELRLQSARDRAEGATAKYEQTEIALKSAKQEQGEASKQLEAAEKDLGEETKNTTEATEDQEQAWGDLKGTMKTAGAAIGIAFAAVAAGGKVLYEVGDTFDEMSDTIRVGTGAVGADLDGMVDVAKAVATSVPTDFAAAASTVADLNTRMGATGKTAETLSKQFIEAGNMAGKALDINNVTGAFSAFNMTAEDSIEGMDHLFRVSQATGIGMDELATTVSAQAPAVQALGFSFEETASMVGMLDRAGLNSTAVMASMSKGLVTLAKEGEQPAQAFERVSAEIGTFVEKGDTASALDLASKVFGTRGATQFVGALESGSLALDGLSKSGLMSADTIIDAAADTHDFAETWTMFKNDVLLKVEPVATRVFDAIGDGMTWIRDVGAPALQDIATVVWDKLQPGFETFGDYFTGTIIPGFKDSVTWIKENEDWLKAVGVAVGITVAAWGAYKLATTAWDTATKIASATQLAFNTVMKANPIGLVVTAIAALVGGLVYFFTQTETGTEIWAIFTGFLGDAWETVTGALTVAWEAVQTGLKAGWDFIYAYIITPYVEYWKFVGSIFIAVKDGIVKAWDLMKTGLKIGWDWIKDKVFEPIKSGAQWVGDKFVLLKDNALAAWDRMKSNLKAGWDWISDKVFGPMKTGVEAIGTVFDKTKDFIGTAWDKIKGVAMKPVNFIIETVYTDGIKKVWDKIAGKIGLKLDLPTVPAIKMATGGVLPGYTPGTDVHHFSSPTAGRLSLSGGEAIMRPEFTRAMGGEAGIHRLNALARAGQLESQAFAGGGVWDKVKSGAKGAWSWTKGAAGATWDWTKNTAESVANFVSDPIAAIAELMGKPVNDFLKTMAPGFVGDVLKQVPGKFLDGFGNWAKEKLFGRETEGGGGSGGPATPGMGWRGQSNIIKSMFPSARITSAFRPGAITATGIPSMHGAGRAVDIAPPSMQMFNRLLAAYPNSQQILYSPAGARQIVWNGRRGNTSGITKQMHYNHVHWAMNQGGVLPSDLNFGTYDTGGVLPPGDTLVSNKTGKPELILNPQQIAGLSQPRGPIDISDESIDALAMEIAARLGLLKKTKDEVDAASHQARILEGMN